MADKKYIVIKEESRDESEQYFAEIDRNGARAVWSYHSTQTVIYDKDEAKSQLKILKEMKKHYPTWWNRSDKMKIRAATTKEIKDVRSYEKSQLDGKKYKIRREIEKLQKQLKYLG